MRAILSNAVTRPAAPTVTSIFIIESRVEETQGLGFRQFEMPVGASDFNQFEMRLSEVKSWLPVAHGL